jgi:hypothetical protein
MFLRRLILSRPRIYGDKAFALLGDGDKPGVDAELVEPRMVLEDALSIVNDKKRLCLEKRWKWTNSNKETIIIRDVFEKVSCWISKFVEVVDVAVQYNPGHAALPWAAVRVLLKVSCVQMTFADTDSIL